MEATTQVVPDEGSNDPTVVGVNIRVPIPIIDSLFGDDDTPHQHRYVALERKLV